MIELEENKRFLLELKNRLNDLESSLNIINLKEELSKLETQTLQEGFWDDSQTSSKIYSKMSSIQKKIRIYNNAKEELENLIDLNDLLLLETDESLVKELLSNSKKLADEFDNIEVQTLLSGKYDANNAIITLHPGAGRNRITRLG